MFQWFIKFPEFTEFTEFPSNLGKTLMIRKCLQVVRQDVIPTTIQTTGEWILSV